MSVQQEVAATEIHEIVESSAMRNTPVAITCQIGGSWRSYRSRFLGLRDGELWVEYPQPEPGREAPQVDLGSRLGAAFKQRHHKYVFTAAVLQVADFALAGGAAVRGVQIEWPVKMQRLQRRAFYRAGVPSDRPAFVEFWQGSPGQDPRGALREKLLYTGKLLDISAGGVRLQLIGDRNPQLQTGDPVGMLLKLHGLDEPLRVGGQFRHAARDEFGTTLGIQFMGLTESGDGRKLFHSISRIVCEYQRIELRRARAGVTQFF